MAVKTLEFPGSIPKESTRSENQGPSVRERLRAKLAELFQRPHKETPSPISSNVALTSEEFSRKQKRFRERKAMQNAQNRDRDETRLNQAILEELKRQGKAPKGAEI